VEIHFSNAQRLQDVFRQQADRWHRSLEALMERVWEVEERCHQLLAELEASQGGQEQAWEQVWSERERVHEWVAQLVGATQSLPGHCTLVD
jgi:hypothetical protein